MHSSTSPSLSSGNDGASPSPSPSSPSPSQSPEEMMFNRVIEEFKIVYERDFFHMKETLHKVEEESRRKEEQLHKVEEESRRKEEQLHKVQEESRRKEEQLHKVEEESRKKVEQLHKVEEESRKKEELKIVYERDFFHMKETLHKVEEESRRKEEQLHKVEEEKARLIEDHRLERLRLDKEREMLLTALLEAHQSRSSASIDDGRDSKQKSEIPGESSRRTIETPASDIMNTNGEETPSSGGSNLVSHSRSSTTDQDNSSHHGDSNVSSVMHWRRRLVLGNRLRIESDIGWAIYTKIVLEVKAGVVVFLCSLVITALFLKDYGLVDTLSRRTQLNRCFIAFALSKHFLWAITVFGFAASSFQDMKIIKLRFADFGIGLTLSFISGVYILPSVCVKRMKVIEGIEIEESPSLSDKTSIFFMMLFVGLVTDTIWRFFLISRDFECTADPANPSLPLDRTNHRSRRSWVEHFLWSFKDSIALILINYILFGVPFFVLFISSNQVQKNPYIEILIFGYLFPVIKYCVAWICNKYIVKECDRLQQTGIKRASIIAAMGAAATIACTLSQMYVIATTSNDYILFCNQEIIKKIFYLIYHPKVIKFRLQVIHLFRKSFGLRASVAVEEHVEVGRGRYTVIVSTMLDDVANEIVGKQFGEDIVFFLATIGVLPLAQENVFFSVYQGPLPSDASAHLPTYYDVLICLVLIAGVLEMISTIISYVALLKVGLHVDHRIHHLSPMNMIMWVLGVSAFTGIIISASA